MISRNFLIIHALSICLIPALTGCAKGDEVVLDIRVDHGYDYIYDFPPDTPGDFPYDPAYDPALDPGYDPVLDPGYDPVLDPGYDPVLDPGYDPGTCTESPCGLKPNCGCPVGQKCTLDDAGGRTCLTAGSGTTGSTCMADEECAAGYICLATNPSGTTAACYAYCDTDADCPGDGAICFQLGIGGVPIDAWTCSYSCDLVTSSGCPAGHGCDLYGIDEDGDTIFDKDFTDCNGEVGTGTQGTYCFEEIDCAPGFVCYQTDAQCIGYCYVGLTSCPWGTSCVTLEAMIGTREVGVCYM